MSDGNKRYLGDVFINKENYEYQKKFFKDIIESYQWKYGGNFDAATLQEKTPDDFATAEQGAKADIAILSPLLLGKQEILNLAQSQYIYTDAIKIDTDGDATDSGRFISLITWFDDLDEEANLSEMLYTIYRNTIDITNMKLDTSVFEEFRDGRFKKIEDIIYRVFEIFTDENGNEEIKLNADLVNGLRFILITKEEYEKKSEAEKNYWRNIFIIRDEIPSLYEDPMKWALSDGYEFRVHNGMIQVKCELSNDWTDMCSLADFLEGANIEGMIKRIVGEELENLLALIKNIDPKNIDTEWRDYPFLSSSLHDIYIKSTLIDGETTYTEIMTDPNDDLSFANINMKQILIDNEVLGPNGNKRINQMYDLINDNESRITALEADVGGIKNDTGLSAQIERLNQRLAEAESLVSTYQSRISNLENAKGSHPIGSIYISVNPENPSTYFGGRWEQLTDAFLFAVKNNADSNLKSPPEGQGYKNAVNIKHDHVLDNHTHGFYAENKDENGVIQHRYTKLLISDGNPKVREQLENAPSSDKGVKYVNMGQTNHKIGVTSSTLPAKSVIKEAGEIGTDRNMPPYLKVYMWKRIE